MLEALDLTSFTCPRCGTTTAADFYGPCTSCCEQLRATMAGQTSELETADYEPKMNVTPNAVASKE